MLTSADPSRRRRPIACAATLFACAAGDGNRTRTVSLGRVVHQDHRLGRPSPAIIGHSFGGVITEKLLRQGIGVAGDAIEQTQIKAAVKAPKFPTPSGPSRSNSELRSPDASATPARAPAPAPSGYQSLFRTSNRPSHQHQRHLPRNSHRLGHCLELDCHGRPLHRPRLRSPAPFRSLSCSGRRRRRRRPTRPIVTLVT